MKTTMRKTLPTLLCSASLLAVAGLSGPAAAQDTTHAPPVVAQAPDEITPAAKPAAPAQADAAPVMQDEAAGAGSPEDAAAADKAEADAEKSAAEEIEAKRKLLEVDPSVVDAVKAFDRNSLIVTREKIGGDTMIINQDIDRAQAIEKLIKLYGVTAFAAAYPDIYTQIKDSPMVLDAKIEMQKSKNDLEDALNPDKGKKDAKPATTKQPRNDGSQFFAMPESSEQPPTAAPKPVAPEKKDAAPAPAETVKADAEADAAPKAPEVKPISLREIYGIGDHLRAVITYGNERTDVIEGDTLPDETKIKSVREKAIDIERDGELTTLRITG